MRSSVYRPIVPFLVRGRTAARLGGAIVALLVIAGGLLSGQTLLTDNLAHDSAFAWSPAP